MHSFVLDEYLYIWINKHGVTKYLLTVPLFLLKYIDTISTIIELPILNITFGLDFEVNEVR